MVRGSTTRSTRSRAARGRSRKPVTMQTDQVPNIYQEMLEEAEARDPEQFQSDRPIKRRRVADTKARPIESHGQNGNEAIAERAHFGSQQVQTVYNSASEEDSDVEWEDVDIPQQAQTLPNATAVSSENDGTIQITFDKEIDLKPTVRRRKPVTAAEKDLRLDVHKSHILCLLAHVHLRNRWCNDEEVQKFLKQMLPKRVVALLHPDPEKPQFTRSTTFIDGLNQAGDVFGRRFRVTKPGLKRAHWAESQTQVKQKLESIMANAEVISSREDFLAQTKTMQGSRDFGAQIFCALLRSVAVEARIVCSLQPLPFSGTVKDMTPSKTGPHYVIISSDDHETSTDERQKPTESPTPSRTRRIGRPEFSVRPTKSSVRIGSRPTLHESSYPVFWIEAFNEAVQKWIPIDPIVTKSLAKPSKFEPPASDPYNLLNYVIAFEDDASARDVTRRYAKAYNAKTRKLRVESTRNGEAWWKRALQTYEKPFLEDRDELEISELTSKSAAEPMPRNIQDFKDHPIYALERHLNRNQVIFPKRAIGHVGLSKTTSKSDCLEPVYRRSNVHTVRSADKWYRLGRDIKMGEQPLKRVPAMRPKNGAASDEEENSGDVTALYAEFQTEIYRPPPIVGGRVPRNVYGNLDVYVPSMVPPGAVHIKHPEAARAARILGIDYADAVTGFDFKGRRGTAVLRGVVIAAEYQEALHEVLMGIAYERQEAALEARTAEVLRFWRLFLIKLRIAERVKGYAAEDEMIDGSVSAMSVDETEEAGGGFFPEPNQAAHIPPREFNDGGGQANAHLDGIDSRDSPLAVSDEEVDDVGGGFISNGCVGKDAVHEPNTSIHPVSASKAKHQSRASEVPKYELVVVPKKSYSGTEEQSIAPQQTSLGKQEGSSEKAPILVDSSATGDSTSASVGVLSHSPSPEAMAHSPPQPDSESEVEKGSLMSEDPEDEDAIPEWLI